MLKRLVLLVAALSSALALPADNAPRAELVVPRSPDSVATIATTSHDERSVLDDPHGIVYHADFQGFDTFGSKIIEIKFDITIDLKTGGTIFSNYAWPVKYRLGTTDTVKSDPTGRTLVACWFLTIVNLLDANVAFCFAYKRGEKNIYAYRYGDMNWHDSEAHVIEVETATMTLNGVAYDNDPTL
ncbi:uncharacterized protein L969DRAFT_95967 [Mixia osmundae IAM 14324]|uniref:Uncharacterized protein n=1 Tax=Mixia osmundae (strain CBS 9802 / IAM 14324 / JCM 22182 / KY 12970) TaxID=764103 RepID=G7DWW1_MIXOS|nr:uncharacterized protein L969DRAFT_55507 [Mixia osmundae IAM 14324]XP_014566698.1 uncharacterized protein L969DRAFT_95967 [Mixia osmundae IAM 14324]KEI36166.1 hypothetical protein L969DRAFT_55507 [Mixia osmundae IAM 14324]KEI38134.1 hypothetical protein L969DRAFT_95967 [Mixia osmundae IAM 14324]GAA95058.1 hypothetical protein E5Q_01713 [Mixia osmundae IAM 14324]